MNKFTQLKGKAAPLPVANIDTDAIIPKQFLKTIKRTGLGKYLFNDWRYTPDNQEIASFVLNQPGYRQSQILIAGVNFGCGSSREHAPWALLDFGIRCIIAPSFADIFYNNCFKNGVLPLVLPQDQVDQLLEIAQKGGEITIDLETQTVTTYPQNLHFNFSVDSFRRHCLLNGLDDVGLTEQRSADISDYEKKIHNEKPWL